MRPTNQSITVTTATPITLLAETFPTAPVVIAALPGEGGTLAVDYQIAAGGTWHAWPAGTVATATLQRLCGAIHALRFTAASANGVVELAG